MSGEQRLSDPSGQVIADRYELVGLIGRGGYGVVCRAVDRLTGEPVAIKMLNDVAARDPQHVERLKREHEALTALAGTNAVRLIDICPSPSGRLCLVMELLIGVDLEQRLEELEGRGELMTYTELLALLAPIVETLERAHGAGILHRDLKPANIFLVAPEAGGGVRLLDFGLVRIRQASPLTAAGTVLGSPSYIAPEVWKGRTADLDQRVDVYSLGVIVFRVLTGKLPFEGESLQSKFIMTTTAPRPSIVELRAELPPKADAWIQQVLAIEPDERFETVRAAYDSLSVALTGRAGSLAPAPDKGRRAREPGGLAGAWRKATSIVKRLVQREEAADREVPWDTELELEPDPEPVSPAPPPPPSRTAPRPAPERSMVTEWLAQSELDLDRGWDEIAESSPGPKQPSRARPAAPRPVESARIISIGPAEETQKPSPKAVAEKAKRGLVKSKPKRDKPAKARASKARASSASEGARRKSKTKLTTDLVRRYPSKTKRAKRSAKTASKRRK
jgi:eukaryotic-like serine/threonine-protein kinase